MKSRNDQYIYTNIYTDKVTKIILLSMQCRIKRIISNVTSKEKMKEKCSPVLTKVTFSLPIYKPKIAKKMKQDLY